jgi:hypothetical protein
MKSKTPVDSLGAVQETARQDEALYAVGMNDGGFACWERKDGTTLDL